MKTLKYLQIAASAGLLFVGAGCVHERVTYVTQVPPAAGTPPPAEPQQPPPAPAPILRSSAELDRMLAPIALYPDPLTAQILPAATVPEQVADADEYVRQGKDLNRVEFEPWDQSVKALTRYPDVLRMMGGNLPWTTDLGVAFVNQGGDVMDSIQRLRAQARAIGNLRTTPEQVVIVEDRIIQIVPANPQIIYVPVYRPEIVYVRPPPPSGFNIVFSIGRPIGPWLNHDVNWRNRDVIVWQRDHPRPHDWWYEPPSRHERPLVVNNNTTVVNNYTVWQPRDRRNDGQRNDNRDRLQTRDGRNPGVPPIRPGNDNPRTISAPKDPQQSLPPVVRNSRPGESRSVTPLGNPGDGRTPLAPGVPQKPVTVDTRPGTGPVADQPHVPNPPRGREVPPKPVRTPPTNAIARTLPQRDLRLPPGEVQMKPGNPRPAPPERAPALRGKEETKTNSRPASIKNSAEKPGGPERKAEKKSQVKKSPGHETNSAPLNDVEKPR